MLHMSRRTRLFLVVSAAVLVVGLGTGMLASYMGLQNLIVIGGNGPDELAYVPQDAELVAYANVRDVMDSDLRRRLFELRPDERDRGRRDFEASTGINVETDVDLVVASLTDSTVAPDRALILARGRFDEVRIEGVVRERGGDVEEYGGRRLLTVPGDDRSFSLAFLEPGLVAFGSPAAVRQSIDTGSAGTDITGNEEVMRLVRDVDDGNAWAVGRFEAVAGSGRLPDAVARQLPPIAWFAATGRIDSGVQGVVRAEATSEEAAGNLRELIRGFVALARLQTRENDDLAGMLNSLELGGSGSTVSLAFTVPAEAIDALAVLQQRRRPEPLPPVTP
jgi:hypothetical protein